MILQHSAIYLIARGVPSLIGFTTIIIYSRRLTPEAYGQYALVVTGAILGNAVLYQWLSASLLRFLPQYQKSEEKILVAILGGYISVSIMAGLGGTLLVIAWWETVWGEFIVIGILLMWMQAWFTINVELVRSRLAPVRYGLISIVKAVVALGLGGTLVLCGVWRPRSLDRIVIRFFRSDRVGVVG